MKVEERSTPEIAVIPSKRSLTSWSGATTVHILLIVLLALFAYSNTFNVPFLYDDFRFIPENPLIKDFVYFTNPDKAEGLSLEDDVFRYFKTRQVGFLSFWASYKLGELDVRGYHGANLSIHIINSALVYFIIMLIFKTPLLGNSRISEKSRFIALFSGLLFATHPMQTEAVTYILQRLVLLTAMFYLLSTAAYIGARLSEKKTSKYGLYALALFSTILAMKTKENAFTLPLAIALCEYIFFRDSTRKRVVLLVPFLLTMLIVSLAYMGLNVGDGGIGTALDKTTRLNPDISRWDYLCTQFRVVTSYIRLLLIPVGQNLDHDPVVYQSFFDVPVFLSLLFLLFLLGLSIYLLYRSRITDTVLRLLAFGIFWFFLALSVESSILPIGEMMVEYRVYLPSAGVFLSLGTGAFLLVDRLKKEIARKVSVSFLAVLLIMFSTATYARNSVWKNHISLWEDVVKKSPDKVRGHYNLGKHYKNAGLFDRAFEQYLIALRLRPDYTEGHNNMGNLYRDKGLTDKAIEHYKTALRLDPDYPEAHNNLGNAFLDKGLYVNAMEHYKTALKLKPDFAEAHNNLGAAFRTMGLFDSAIEHYQTALRIDPGFEEAHKNLGTVFGAIGLYDKAIEHLQIALRLNPNLAGAHYYLGLAYLKKGLIGKARREFEAAIKIDPSFNDALQYLNR